MPERDEPRAASDEPQATPAQAQAGSPAAGAERERRAEAQPAGKGQVLDAHGAAAAGPSVAAHPRAARSVARAKSWAGLAGFGLGAYFSLPTGTLAQALERALVAGTVSYVAVWAAAVFIWRRLVILELKGREQQLLSAAGVPAPAGELPAPRASQARSRTGAR